MLHRNEEEQSRAIAKFVNDAIAFRLPQILPQYPPEKMEALVTCVHEGMKGTGPSEEQFHSNLAKLGITSPEELHAIGSCQRGVGAAISGLGGDMFESNAVSRIVWDDWPTSEEILKNSRARFR